MTLIVELGWGINGLKNAGSGHLASAAKGSAIDLEGVGSGPVDCHFPFPSLSVRYMCSSLTCLSFVLPWYMDHLHQK